MEQDFKNGLPIDIYNKYRKNLRISPLFSYEVDISKSKEKNFQQFTLTKEYKNDIFNISIQTEKEKDETLRLNHFKKNDIKTCLGLIIAITYYYSLLGLGIFLVVVLYIFVKGYFENKATQLRKRYKFEKKKRTERYKEKQLQIFEKKWNHPTSYLKNLMRLRSLYNGKTSTISTLEKWKDNLQETQTAIETSDDKYQIDSLEIQKEYINKEIEYSNKILKILKLYIDKVKKALTRLDIDKQIATTNEKIKLAQKSDVILFMEKDIEQLQSQEIIKEIKTDLNLHEVNDEEILVKSDFYFEQKMDSLTLLESLLE